MYTLDTNAIIYYFEEDSSVYPFLEQIINDQVPVYISTITELELFSFPKLDTEEARRINIILSSLTIIELNSRLAREAGRLRREHRLHTADSAIAATTLETDSTLLTRNVRHFQRVPELKLQEI